MNPEDYIFYRKDLGFEHISGYPPIAYDFKTIRPILASNVRSISKSLDRLMRGEVIRTHFGIYSARKK